MEKVKQVTTKRKDWNWQENVSSKLNKQIATSSFNVLKLGNVFRCLTAVQVMLLLGLRHLPIFCPNVLIFLTLDMRVDILCLVYSNFCAIKKKNWALNINGIQSQEKSTHSDKKYAHVTALIITYILLDNVGIIL